MRTCHAIATMLSIAPVGAMTDGLGNAHNKALFGLQPLLEGGDCSTLSYAELLTRREQAELSGKGMSTRPPLIERELARREVARLVDHAVALGIVPAHLDPSDPSLGKKLNKLAPRLRYPQAPHIASWRTFSAAVRRALSSCETSSMRRHCLA